MRWLWLKKTQPDRPWAGFDLQVHPNSLAMFSISVCSIVGSGERTLFWTDRWLHGKSLTDLAPALVALVPKRFLNRRTVLEALTNNGWVCDIRGGLSIEALLEYFQIWDILNEFQLSLGVEDQHLWAPSVTGEFSCKSAYVRFFTGAVEFEPWKLIWKSWTPPRCKFFMWLAILNRCWTADRLARRGLDHPDRCPLCDQADETIQHLLFACVFARGIWFSVLSITGLQQLTPNQDGQTLQEWWSQAQFEVTPQCRKGFNSLVILIAWWLWKHRNSCVFEGASPSYHVILQDIQDDAKMWCMAGAKGLSSLWP
uniref:Reverse transcriptase zinc-binding domain-containing protein n=1 Tax=Arundo donax TaxID=35708 RepID=A0A0A9HR92_ARUDO